MKNYIALLISFFLLSFPINSVNIQSDRYVYICTGNYAQCYHCRSNCSGLNNCHADIKRVTLNYAKSLNRKPCKKCYK